MSGNSSLLRLVDDTSSFEQCHEDTVPEIVDLRIEPGALEPDFVAWRVRVAVPLVKSENVALLGIARSVHLNLGGRFPDTFWNPIKERFVAGFAVHDSSPESLKQVGAFALSLAEALQPMTAGDPWIYLERFGRTVEAMPAS